MSAPAPAEMRDAGQVLRYLVNGVVATIVHFSVLAFNIEVLGMASAGLANAIAAVVGTTVSFVGSRHYVFRKAHDPILGQAARFVTLYAAIAVVHGLVLFGWSDVLGFDYRLGFLIATAVQVMMSFWGNKRLVF